MVFFLNVFSDAFTDAFPDTFPDTSRRPSALASAAPGGKSARQRFLFESAFGHHVLFSLLAWMPLADRYACFSCVGVIGNAWQT